MKQIKSKTNELKKNVLTTHFNSIGFGELIYGNSEQLPNLREIITDSVHCNFKVTVFCKRLLYH